MQEDPRGSLLRGKGHNRDKCVLLWQWSVLFKHPVDLTFKGTSWYLSSTTADRLFQHHEFYQQFDPSQIKDKKQHRDRPPRKAIRHSAIAIYNQATSTHTQVCSQYVTCHYYSNQADTVAQAATNGAVFEKGQITSMKMKQLTNNIFIQRQFETSPAKKYLTRNIQYPKIPHIWTCQTWTDFQTINSNVNWS